MIFSVSQVTGAEQTVLDVQGELTKAQLDDRFTELELDGLVRFIGKISQRNIGEIFVQGHISFVWKLPCDRCTKISLVPIEIEVQEVFERDALKQWAEEVDQYTFTGDQIDLSPMIQDNILLHFPLRVLCDEHCKGLCPVCGCDRNTTHCTCQKEAAADYRPLAALAALLCDDEEV